jgi:hypothetical protein
LSFERGVSILESMKIIVTHTSPDWDAITSVWLLKRFLSGWQEAQVEFVPAGEKSSRVKNKKTTWKGAVELISDDEVIHVDTGLTPLDHHQTSDTAVSAASRTWEYVRDALSQSSDHLTYEHEEAVNRIVTIVVAIDHFKEVFWKDAAADYHEFSLLGLLEGLKLEKPNQDPMFVAFGIQCLNAMVHNFENRIWAEREIAQNGKAFTTKWGKGIGFATINDTVLKLSQKMGYNIVVRKDPRKGYLRIKAKPSQNKDENIDLTLAYEKFRKIDPDATWFLHVSKKMLLNGTPKNPKMVPTKLSLDEVIAVLKNL